MGRCIFGRYLHLKAPPVNRTSMIFSLVIIESCHNPIPLAEWKGFAEEIVAREGGERRKEREIAGE
ncbi:hypothetical protein YC2023_114476 [Brassica napus]